MQTMENTIDNPTLTNDKIILSPEELKSIQALNNELNELTLSLGSIEMELNELSLSKTHILNSLKTLRENQIKVGNDLNAKYGNGAVDLNTGEFIPSK
jgi:prefoldin subunit 5